jgi:hypothetical protein
MSSRAELPLEQLPQSRTGIDKPDSGLGSELSSGNRARCSVEQHEHLRWQEGWMLF